MRCKLRRMTRLGGVVRLMFAAVSLAGCSAVFLQDDGFASRIPSECSSEKKCTELVTEAEARVARCQPNTVGYVRCDDARADLIVIRGRLDAIRARREDLERQHADAIRAKEDAEKVRLFAAEAERQEEEKRLAREARNAEIRQTRAILSCSNEIDRSKCLDATKPADCRFECDIEIAKTIKSEMGAALARCVRRYVAEPNAPTSCAPDEKIAKEAGADAVRTCAIECKKLGPGVAREVAQQTAAEAREAAAEAAHERAEASGSAGGCTCNDGSAGCCGRGCCSRHGGIAGGGSRGGGGGGRHRAKRR